MTSRLRSWRSIELRLTAWFSLMLFTGYVFLGLVLWSVVRRSVSESFDAVLEERIEKLVATVESDADGPEEVEEDLIELILASPEGELARVRDAEGRQVFPFDESEPSFITAESRPDAYRLVARDVSILGERYEILLVSSLDSLESTSSRLIVWLSLAAPVAFVLSAMGGLVISRRALTPVDAIAAAASNVTVENLGDRLDVPDTGDALERLSRTFNEMLDRLETSVRRIEQFTGDASHELRTPVAIIRTTAELALRQRRKPEGFRKDMETIRTEAEALGDLIDVLLTLSREGVENGALAMSEVDLNAVASSVCARERASAERKGLALELEISETPLYVHGNDAALSTLVTALVTNAVEHTNEGYVRVAVHEESSTTLELHVRDTGEGIPDDDLPHVFERFYRGDSARKRAGGHVGLGLSIAARIAELHRAKITLTSRIGEGSTFAVVFPRGGTRNES